MDCEKKPRRITSPLMKYLKLHSDKNFNFNFELSKHLRGYMDCE